jgi:hypothetical protein
VIVWLCLVSSLGVLGERNIGKEEEREREREIKIRGERERRGREGKTERG